MLLVTCPCGERLEAPDSQAGQQVPCPACGKPVDMPLPYNPLATARYVTQPDDAPPAAEERVAGAPCADCAESGKCRFCHGEGRLNEPFLERMTNGISGAISGFFGAVSSLLGADSGKPRKFQTRSDKRRAGGCPACEGTGKCFSCEGTGRNQ